MRPQGCAREAAFLFLSPEEERSVATNNRRPRPIHSENTFAPADWSARTINAHSSGEIVKSGARRTWTAIMQQPPPRLAIGKDFLKFQVESPPRDGIDCPGQDRGQYPV